MQAIPSNTSKELRRLKIFLWAVCAAVLLLYSLTAVYSSYTATPTEGYWPIDDAYIFVRYADNILAGYGPAWNPGGESTYGTTSLTYLFFMVLARAALALDVTSTVQLLSGLFSVVFVVFLGLLTASQSRSRLLHQTPMTVLMVLVIFLTQKTYLYHALSGMDTTLGMSSMVLLLAAVFRMAHVQSIRSVLVVAGVAYWCFLTRPDSGLYAFLFPVLALLCWDIRERRRLLLVFGGAFVAFLVVDVVWKTWLFGAPLPLPFYVKNGDFYMGYAGYQRWNNVSYLFIAVEMALFPLLILLFVVRKQDWRLLLPFLLPVFLHVMYLHGVLQITGKFARYYMLIQPFVVTASFLTLDRRVEAWERAYPQRVLQIALRGSYALLLLVVPSLIFGDKVAGVYRKWVLQPVDQTHLSKNPPPHALVPALGWKESMLAFSELLPALPKDAVIAMSEVGQTGTTAPHLQIVDLAGLNDRRIAHEGFTVDYVLSNQPDLIWLPHTDYTDQVQELLSSSRFRKEYTVYPGLFDWGVAVRKSSPHLALLNSRLREVGEKYYPGLSMTVGPASSGAVEGSLPLQPSRLHVEDD